MAPHPPNPLPVMGISPNSPSTISEIQANKIREIVDRTFKNFKLSDLNLQPREAQPQNPPATVTVIATNPPTTTIVTAPPVTSSPVDTSDQSVESNTSLNGGAIAGIVIGSIVGLLLLIWIFRSCSNLGAPPTDTPSKDGRAWYDGVRGVAIEEPATRRPYRETHEHRRHHHRHGSRSRSRHGHHHHHHSHSPHHYRRSAEIREVSQVREVPVAVVRSSSRRRSSRRDSRSPYRVYDDDGYYGYTSRGGSASRSRSRSRSRGRR